jgi:hypothetical protein
LPVSPDRLQSPTCFGGCERTEEERLVEAPLFVMGLAISLFGVYFGLEVPRPSPFDVS